jgi:hypothetical protein
VRRRDGRAVPRHHRRSGPSPHPSTLNSGHNLDLDGATADRLAAAVADYPLAAAQIAAYLDENPMPAATYLTLFEDRRAALAGLGKAADYPLSARSRPSGCP